MLHKPVLMIHEMREEFFELPLEKYILTFDDGLYSQYYYFDRLKSINTEKIFFISSGIICEGKQSNEFPECAVAHQKAFAGNMEDYMTLDQVKELMTYPNVRIGGHSHSHKRLDSFPKLFDKSRHIQEDTTLMLKWFENNLGFKPNVFCFPYNEDIHGLYSAILKGLGITECYGRGRIPIETLLQTETQLASRETVL